MLSVDPHCILDPRTASSSSSAAVASSSSLVVTPPPPPPPSTQAITTRNKTIFLVRHAEAEHNILERRAVEAAMASGSCTHDEKEQARKAILQNPSLKDSPLSSSGKLQVRRSSLQMQQLLRVSSRSSDNDSNNSEYKTTHFQRPQVVLVSPLRRALMTATELFLHNQCCVEDGDHERPRFVAMEILREKRTGLACDERSSVEELQREFPHVNFDNLMDSSSSSTPEPGEDNALVRQRTRVFLENILATIPYESVAIVSHKGWLRELRHVLKDQVDNGELTVDFDVKEWHQTLYRNAEVRVAEFGYDPNDGGRLVSIVSRSVDNAISSLTACTAAANDDYYDDNE